jgi:hypothetical protein
MDELFSVIDNITNNPNSANLEDRFTKMQIAHQNITGISGSFASDRILDTLENINIEPDTFTEKTPKPINVGISQSGLNNRGRLVDKIYNKLKRNNSDPNLLETGNRQLAYARQKYPGISLEEIQLKLINLQNITNRFGRLQIHQYGYQSFCILSE